MTTPPPPSPGLPMLYEGARMVVQPEANLPHHYMPSCPLVRINSTTCTVAFVGKPLRVPHEQLRVDTVPYTWVHTGLDVRDQDGRLEPGWKWTAWTVAEHLAHSAPDRAMPRPRLASIFRVVDASA